MLITLVTLVAVLMWAMIYMAVDMYLGFRRIHARYVADKATLGDTPRIP